MGKMTCGLVYATKLQISEVEDWLDANCGGDWDLALADLNTGGGDVAKKVEIYFELPADRDLFKTLFAGFERDKLAGGGASDAGGGGGGGGEPKKGGFFSGMMRPDKR